jgi:hypothetical protein
MPTLLMNTDKATKLLKKIQALYENLGDQGSMSSLERDLLLNYLRELYEEVSHATPGATSMRKEVEPPKITATPPEPKPALRMEPVVERTPPPPEPVIKPEPPAVPEPKFEEVRQSPVTSYTSPAPEPKEMPVMSSVSDQVAVAEDEITDEVIALFEFKQIGELSEKLKMQPIERVEQGMGINERILMINELFGGDSDAFRKTLADVNELTTFSAAREYLIRNVAARYNWSESLRKPQAMGFIHLVRRKFISQH